MSYCLESLCQQNCTLGFLSIIPSWIAVNFTWVSSRITKINITFVEIMHWITDCKSYHVSSSLCRWCKYSIHALHRSWSDLVYKPCMRLDSRFSDLSANMVLILTRSWEGEGRFWWLSPAVRTKFFAWSVSTSYLTQR